MVSKRGRIAKRKMKNMISGIRNASRADHKPQSYTQEKSSVSRPPNRDELHARFTNRKETPDKKKPKKRKSEKVKDQTPKWISFKNPYDADAEISVPQLPSAQWSHNRRKSSNIKDSLGKHARKLSNSQKKKRKSRDDDSDSD
mmetsp:Transcript_13625/g.21094  ORF Transcript_13625/g.21094 Transcript_13625/m.21094 type:complete len:143 (-) Transcript_13625:19-447(-)